MKNKPQNLNYSLNQIFIIIQINQRFKIHYYIQNKKLLSKILRSFLTIYIIQYLCKYLYLSLLRHTLNLVVFYYIYNTLASKDLVSLIPVYIIISDNSSFILSSLVTTPSLPSDRSGPSIPLPTDTAWAPSAKAL